MRSAQRLKENAEAAEIVLTAAEIAALDELAENARQTMGGLFAADPCPLSQGECTEIFRKSYR